MSKPPLDKSSMGTIQDHLNEIEKFTQQEDITKKEAKDFKSTR